MIVIETLEGLRYDLDLQGIKPISFEVDSPSPRTEREEVEGSDGHIDIETTFEGRSMRASFLIQSSDFADYHVVRHEIFKLFNAKKQFYVIDSRLPKQRWKVRTAAKYSLERINFVNGIFVLELLSSSTYAESITTTLDVEGSDYLFQVDTEEQIQYSFNTTTFFVWNNGDVGVDPVNRWAELIITFKGPSENLSIQNLTTGDEWAITETTTADDVITLDGIKSFKNGMSVFGKTNKKLITLAPGRNDFEIVGALGQFLLTFDFRFYYF